MDRATQAATIFLGLFGVGALLMFTRDISAPFVLALAAGVVLAPLTDLGERLGLSAAASALASLVLTLVMLGGMALLFQPIAAAMIEAAPRVWRDLQDLINLLRGFARGMSDLTQEVSGAVVAPATAAEAGADGMDVPLPNMTDALMLAPAILSQLLIFAGSLFFFLMSRGEIYDAAARRLASPENRAVVATRLRAAERSVSRYFLTVTAINAGLGVATGVAMALIGLPEPALWGAAAFVLNFVVYLGPAVLALGLAFSGVAAFDGAMVLVPAAIFVGLNTIEGQFATPALIGRQSEVNPLAVFAAIIFGLWLWGPIGGIVAIPLLLWVRVLSSGGPSPSSQAVAAR